jgi:hypothetical protein
VRLAPVEIVVSGPGEVEQHVPVTDATREALRGIVSAGLAVASICLVIMLIAGLVRLARRATHAGKEANHG